MRLISWSLPFLLASIASAQIPAGGLRLWLRADAGVATTNGRVDSWTDQTGGQAFIPRSNSYRPYQLTDSSGAPLIRFQGNEYLQGRAPFTLTNATIFALFRYRGDSDNDYLYAFGASGTSGSQMTLSRRSRGRAYHYDGSRQNIQGTIPRARWVVSTQLYGAAAPGSHETRIDGVTQITSSASGYSTNFINSRVGNWSGGSYLFRGDLAHLIVYDRNLTSGEIATVESWLGGLATGARTMTYGVGCTGTAGIPDLRPVSGSVPRSGSTFRTEVLSVPSVGQAFMLFGFDDTFFSGGAVPLPVTLASLSLPNCTVYVSADVVFPIPSAGGSAPWSVAIPSDPAMQKTCFHLQSVVLDPGANWLGVSLSNALTATIGS